MAQLTRLSRLLALLLVLLQLLSGSMVGRARAMGAAQERPRRAKEKPTAEKDEATPTNPAGDELERIKAAPTQEERISALERFIRANRTSPREADAREMLMKEYALRGEEHLREGAPQRAAQDFKLVFRTAPAEITDKIFGQYVFPLPMAMSAFGYRSESVELMRAFETRFQNDPNRLIQIGFFYVQIEAPIEAVRILEKATALAPQDHRAHNSLGTAYLINLRLEDAETEFSRALDLDSNDEYANLNLANLLRARGDNEKAAAYYRAQLKLKSDDGEAHGGLAIALLALGQDEEAEKEIAAATSVAPQNYRFFNQLAYYYTIRKKLVPARAMLERAVRIEPRYAWAFITKANIDALESRFGDSLSTVIQSQQLATFPTLGFELAKALMLVDGYEQAVGVLNKTFAVSEDGEFEATLGGVMKARSPRLDLLLDRERRAALFLKEQTTTTMQYRLAEALLRMDHYLKVAVAAKLPQNSAKGARSARPSATASRRPGRRTGTRAPKARADDSEDAVGADTPEVSEPASRARRAKSADDAGAELSAGPDSALPGMTELLKAIKTFTSLDDGRQAFRMVWVARTLAENTLALDASIQLARRALAMAEAATEPAGGMRDAPLLDRQGRLDVFVGRAEDVLGWALLKKGDNRGALQHLTKSIDAYPLNKERKGALWHLAVATEQAGDESHALEYYIASYDPTGPSASVRRTQIELLYKKVKGSLDGLEDRLR